MRKLLLEMLIIISLVTAFGAWALNEWQKSPAKTPDSQNKKYLWVGDNKEWALGSKKIISVNEWRKPIKSEEKQVKVYQGKWHKTYLEVIGK